MCQYVLVEIVCLLFEGYSLFCLGSVNCAESIAVWAAHSVGGNKKQNLSLSWLSGTICRVTTDSAVIKAKVYAVSETFQLCEQLSEAFGLNCGGADKDKEKERETLGAIWSLIKGPKHIRHVNELLMERWVFADMKN